MSLDDHLYIGRDVVVTNFQRHEQVVGSLSRGFFDWKSIAILITTMRMIPILTIENKECHMIVASCSRYKQWVYFLYIGRSGDHSHHSYHTPITISISKRAHREIE